MPDGAKADVKLGFWIGVGLLLLGILLAVIQMILGKALGSGARGGR